MHRASAHENSARCAPGEETDEIMMTAGQSHRGRPSRHWIRESSRAGIRARESRAVLHRPHQPAPSRYSQWRVCRQINSLTVAWAASAWLAVRVHRLPVSFRKTNVPRNTRGVVLLQLRILRTGLAGSKPATNIIGSSGHEVALRRSEPGQQILLQRLRCQISLYSQGLRCTSSVPKCGDGSRSTSSEESRGLAVRGQQGNRLLVKRNEGFAT